MMVRLKKTWYAAWLSATKRLPEQTAVTAVCAIAAEVRYSVGLRVEAITHDGVVGDCQANNAPDDTVGASEVTLDLTEIVGWGKGEIKFSFGCRTR